MDAKPTPTVAPQTAIPLPGGTIQYHPPSVRPEVHTFAALMESRLRENAHKSGWLHCNLPWLLSRLEGEVLELQQAILRRDPPGGLTDISREAADVGNFAMMIVDVWTHIEQRHPKATP